MWDSMLHITLFCVLCVFTEALTPTKYMVNYCSSTIYVNSSLVLELTNSPVENRYDVGYLHCATNIITDPHSNVYLHFLVLDIAHESQTPDRFHLYDFNDDGVKVQLTPTKGIYGVFEKPYYTTNTLDMPVRDYQSSGNKFRLDFLGKPTYIYQGFAVLLTSVKGSRSGECDSGYFYCQAQGICIPGELRCDSQPNCGSLDGSDEFNCAALEETVTSLLSSYSVFHAVLAAVVGVVVFLLFTVCIVLYIRKYNRRKYPFTKAIAVLRGGVCTLSTNLDMERLYAPPSYEDVMAGTSRGNDPPPDYSEYIRSTRNQDFSDSDDDSISENIDNTSNEFIDLHPKRKVTTPKRSISRTSVHKAMCHDRPATPENLRDPSPASGDIRTNSPSSGSNPSLIFTHIGDDSYLDSENEAKSGDSGIENSRERIISKRATGTAETSHKETIISRD